MKKLFAGLLICVLLMNLFASCSGNTKSLTKCGEEVISLMAEMIENEAYQSLYHLANAHDEEINKLRKGNYSKTATVYELTVSEETLLDTAMNQSVNKDAFSEDLYQYICTSAYVSFASLINQKSDTEALIVSSVFTAQKSFIDKNTNENKLYLYVFENGCPIVISFISDGNGAFRAVGQFIINDTFVTDDEHSIEASLDAMKITGVTVTKQ